MKRSKMKTMKKRILALLLCGTMVLNTGVSASADEGTTIIPENTHVHTEECYEKSKTENLICTKPEVAEEAAHVHEEKCFEVTFDQKLTCTQEETAGHSHSDSCVETKDVLTCGTDEHTHGGECYTTETKNVCGQEESETHTHDAGCVEETETLTCSVSEHTHGGECYTTETNIVCGQEEMTAHTHGEGCYTTVENKTQICTLEEAEAHTHSDDCYEWEEKLICTIEETALAKQVKEEPVQKTSVEGTKEAEKKELVEVNIQNADETGITVSIKSTSDVLAEDAKVVVAPMEADEEIETALAEAAGELDVLGYVAYDISLKNADDTDVSLGENKVDVAIDFAEAIPEGINAEEVKEVVLVHITTDEEGNVAAETVGTVEVTEDKKATKAEFEAASFSPYVVTWLGEVAEEVDEEPVAEEPVVEDLVLTYTSEDEKYTVTATAKPEILENVAALEATLITEETKVEELTQKLSEKATEAQKTSLGFEAYEFKFFDAEGNEVSVNGEVKVSFTYMEAMIPEAATAENVDAVDVALMETEKEVLEEINSLVSAEAGAVKEVLYTTEAPEELILAWSGDVYRTLLTYEGQKPAYEDDEVIVTLVGTEYALQNVVGFNVMPIKEDNEETKEQYAEVAQQLEEKIAEDNEENEEEKEVVGFLAYDITLVDAEGNELEPQGNVRVSMEYKEAAVPGTVTTENVAEVTVMHHKEVENVAGETEIEVVDMVADENIEAIVKTTETKKIERANFETDGFSVFSITWYGYVNEWTISAQIVDTNGKEIVLSQDINVTGDGEFLFSSISQSGANSSYYNITDVNGKTYTFEKATIEGTNIYSIGSYRGWLYYRTNEFGSYKGIDEKTIYLVYKENNSDGSDGTEKTNSVSFTKVDSSGAVLSGAEFMLYKSDGVTEIEKKISGTDGIVCFEELETNASYIVKEIKAPEGYIRDKSSWDISVQEGIAVMQDGNKKEVKEVINYTEKEEAVKNLTSDKTTKLINEENRIFEIDLTASTVGKTDDQEAKGASIVLVLDKSSSMEEGDKDLDDVKDAAKDFVNEIYKVSPSSEIAVIWYGGTQGGNNTTSNSGFQTLSTNKTTVENKISSASASGGTPMGDALNEAQTTLESAKYDAKYVLFFTDGMPGYWSNSTTRNCMVANSAYTAATAIKESAIIYTVGYKLEGSFTWKPGHSGTSYNSDVHGDSGRITTSATDYLKDYIATQPTNSAEKYAYTVDDKENLKKEFASLAGRIGSLFEVHAEEIVDVIDSRFELTEESKSALKTAYGDDVTITENADGTTTISWKGDAAKIGNSAATGDALGAWNVSIQVQAKADFIGGNMIPTNGITSGIYVDDDTTKLFPQPSVNVKILDLSLSGDEYTIYKGDEEILGTFVGNLADSLKITKLYNNTGEIIEAGQSDVPKLTEEQIESLKEEKKIEINYSYSETGDVVGKFVFEYDKETTTLNVTYVPNAVEIREEQLGNVIAPTEDDGTIVESKEARATNIINVISGAIQINKQLDKAPTEDKEFTFTITYKDSEEILIDEQAMDEDVSVMDNVTDDIGAVISEEFTFPQVVTVIVKANQTNGTYKLEDLARGTYTIVENEAKGYILESVAVNDSTNCQANVSENSVTYMLGNDKAGNDVIKEYKYNSTDGGTLGVVDVKNEKSVLDWNIYKRSDSSNTLYLEGAEFELKLVDGTNESTWYKGVSDSDGVIKWYKNGENLLEDGEYIEKGEYDFKEVKAPEGYVLSGEKWIITIGSYGSLKSITGNSEEPVQRNEAVIYYFDNTLLYELPSTGGHGIHFITLSGLTLMLGAAYVWFMYRRKEML